MLSFLSLLVPTKDQMTSYIRTGLKWGGSALVTHGISVSPSIWSAVAGDAAVQVYVGIVMAVIPVLVDRVVHSDAGKLKSAGTLATGPDPVIAPIIVLPEAPAPIQAVAEDKSVPGVRPLVVPTVTQRR